MQTISNKQKKSEENITKPHSQPSNTDATFV